MSTEEPAWKAELKADLARIAHGLDRHYSYAYRDLESTVFIAIQAAEERGRQEAPKDHIKGLKADWSRFRGRVLQEAWEAMRDAEGGPLIDAMSVINDLMEKK